MKIYVAGPYRAPHYKGVWNNVQKAIEVGVELAKKGHHPYIPHTNYFWIMHPSFDFTPEEEFDFCMKQDFEWLKVCDALFFIGPSEGANMELEMAKKMGMKIFTSLEQVTKCHG